MFDGRPGAAVEASVAADPDRWAFTTEGLIAQALSQSLAFSS